MSLKRKPPANNVRRITAIGNNSRLSPFELIAIRDAAARSWHIVSRKDYPPSDELLRQVGLVSKSTSAALEKASQGRGSSLLPLC